MLPFETSTFIRIPFFADNGLRTELWLITDYHALFEFLSARPVSAAQMFEPDISIVTGLHNEINGIQGE
jgi:hypothetical protein